MKHVIVVGAGLSGLTAAYELSKEKRFAITILEKEDHIGGRTHAVQVNGVAVDVGGFIVYPWYKNFRKILDELKITKKLKSLPQINIFYLLSQDTKKITEKNLPISIATKGRLTIKLLPAFLNNLDVAHPDIKRFGEVSVRDFFKKHRPAIHDPLFEECVDTICQGYCYPPTKEYRAAFMLPMMGNNIFFGDVNSSDYFPMSTATLITSLERALKKRGVTIQKNTTVQNIEKQRVTTEKETLHADAIVLSHPVNINISFTRFITLTVLCDSKPKIKENASWGALFLHPATCTSPNILSIINTEELYGKKLKNTLTLNIKLSHMEPFPTANVAYEKYITHELKKIFPALKKITITSYTPWNHTMPISSTKTIQKLREDQGKDGIYYAGDYLGCPSMETAVTTGMDAAKLIKQKS